MIKLKPIEFEGKRYSPLGITDTANVVIYKLTNGKYLWEY